VLRAIQAVNPDFIYVASQPTDTVGIIRAAHEIWLKAAAWSAPNMRRSKANSARSLSRRSESRVTSRANENRIRVAATITV
jgi:hypothetical protein